VLDVNEANISAKEAIVKGAEHIIFNIEDKTISLKDLLKDIDISIHLNLVKFSISKVEEISDLSNIENITYNNDIIGNLGKTGNWFSNLKTDHTTFELSVKKHNQIYIDLSHYQNAGATNVQQLAYALAHTNEYLNHLDNTNISLVDIKIIFNVAVGSNYFFEISKLRALRKLWFTLAEAYDANPYCKIVATPSKRNKTIYDYNINMLRSTTECMSAVLGGANIVYNQPYNQLFQNNTEFGERISRNQLLILKKESYLNTVNNPSDGSYYIESLTKQLATRALSLFKDIEKNDGILSQLKEGKIQQKIKESAQKEQADFDKNEITLLGTNKHPNPEDKMKNELEKSPFLKIEKRKTLIQPIIQKRLSEQLEIERLKTE